jgi:hypothetical protein
MMEEIGLHNYEAWLLDYSEGHLNQQEIAALQTFVLLHPQLEIDLSVFELPSLEKHVETFPDASLLQKEFTANEEAVLSYIEDLLPLSDKLAFELRLQQDVELQKLLTAFTKTLLVGEATAMPGKDGLFKTENADVVWPMALLYVEQSLDADDVLAYTKKLQNDSSERAEVAAFAATKLQADVSIVHPNKKALLKSAKVITLFAAREFRVAAAILLLLVFVFLLRLSTGNNHNQIESIQVASQAPSNKQINVPAKNNTHSAIVPLLAQTQATVKAAPKSNVPAPTAVVVQPSVKIQTNTTQAQPELPQMAQRIVEPQSIETSVIQATETPSIENSAMYASVDDLEIGDDFSPLDAPDKKSALWHRAVDLARKVNRLGFTAINGNEVLRKHQYSLSFNSFSVEKK